MTLNGEICIIGNVLCETELTKIEFWVERTRFEKVRRKKVLCVRTYKKRYILWQKNFRKKISKKS